MVNLIEFDNTVVIYGVVEGPFHSSEIPDWDEDDDCWMLVCQVENGVGALEIEELTFYTFDDAYEIVKHFKKGCRPFTIEIEPNLENDPDFPDFLKG